MEEVEGRLSEEFGSLGREHSDMWLLHHLELFLVPFKKSNQTPETPAQKGTTQVAPHQLWASGDVSAYLTSPCTTYFGCRNSVLGDCQCLALTFREHRMLVTSLFYFNKIASPSKKYSHTHDK